MGASLKSGAACAKARAMYGMRITRAEYEALISGRSIPAVVAYLKNHPLYGEVMVGADENTIKRGALEELIKRSIGADYRKLVYFMSDLDQKTLRIYTLKSEIEFILRVIIGLRNRSGSDRAGIIATAPQFYDVAHSENMMSLLAAGSFPELIALMEKTRYAGALEGFDLNKSDTAVIETVLFNHFYSQLFKFINANYDRDEAGELARLLGVRIDIENIRRMVRLGKYFTNVSYERYMLGFGYRLGRAELERVADPDDPAEFLFGVMPIYGEYYKEADTTGSDAGKDRIQLALDKNTLRMSKSAVAVAIAYLSIRSVEIKNLFHIIECIRYELPTDEARGKITDTEDKFER